MGYALALLLASSISVFRKLLSMESPPLPLICFWAVVSSLKNTLHLGLIHSPNGRDKNRLSPLPSIDYEHLTGPQKAGTGLNKYDRIEPHLSALGLSVSPPKNAHFNEAPLPEAQANCTQALALG